VFLVWGTAAPGTTEPVGPAGPRLHGPGATEPVSAGDDGGPGNRDTEPGAP
jgi:hypothetical protein